MPRPLQIPPEMIAPTNESSRRLLTLGKLSAGLAHELNNPLGVIQANVETMADYTGVLTDLVFRYREACLTMMAGGAVQPDAFADAERSFADNDLEFIAEDAPEMVRETLEGAGRAAELVAAMKDFARSEPSAAGPVDLNQTVESALLVVNNELKYHCTIERQLTPVPSVSMCRTHLHEALVTLFTATGRAIPDRGEISVATMSDGEAVVLTLRSSAPELDATEFGGLVGELGGRWDADSDAAGTTVRIHFPA